MPRIPAALRDGLSELVHPGESELSRGAVERLTTTAVALVMVTTNLVGAASVLLISLFAVPLPPVGHAPHVRLVNAVVAAAYVAAALAVGTALGLRGLRPIRSWLSQDQAASPAEVRALLHAPLRLLAVQLGLWVIAAALFGALDAGYLGRLGAEVAVIVFLTGLVTAACAYLLTELVLRPAAARALADSGAGAEGARVPGVATRALLAWAMATGVPVLGAVAIAILAMANPHTTSRQQLAVATVVLGGAGVAVGLLAVTAAARATADPVSAVRRALAAVQRGEFQVRVPVYDGTEIGQLQLGFNAMVAGLAERERLREAFGTYVDPEVARRVLEQDGGLEGEEVEVTLMFIDIRDFTGFAERTPAPEVVAAINRLFERIIPIIHEHHGRVDKFIGDGLLAVFGAPRHQPDHADQAFAAAREIERRLRAQPAELAIGIGLNSGTVVAGNVGGAGRLEFSVIGDAVNVAARVEAATRQTGDTILLAEPTRQLLGDAAGDLVERSEVELKGRRQAVRLYAPAVGGDGR